MTQEELHIHITAAALTRRRGSLHGLGARLVEYCWPGGQSDRYNAANLPWLRQWGPLRTGAAVRECSCASGFCDVCN